MLWTEVIADFLRFAEDVLQEQPDKYMALVAILTEYGRSAVEVCKEVEQQLRGRPLLIIRFNALLPPNLRISSPSTDLVMKQALSLIARVEGQTRHQMKGIYRSFLDLLQMYRTLQKTRLEVASEVLALLKNHHYLQSDFLRFLPPDEITVSFLSLAKVILREQPDKYAALLNVLNKDGRNAVEVRKEVEQLLQDKPTLIIRFNALLPRHLSITTPYIDASKALNRRIMERLRNCEGHSHEQLFLDLALAWRTRSKTPLQASIEMMDLLKNHPDLQHDLFGLLSPDVQSHLSGSPST